jgi:phospholipid/cholesterol/gamma-HCH transport system substrate-binding protein
MDRLSGIVEKPGPDAGLLPALLFDPKHRAVLDDLAATARNVRAVSERVAGGRGTLGSLVKDEPGDGGIQQASRDFQAAMANLKEITEKIKDGDGTVGALIADPTVYERLVGILDGASRSFLLRGLLRGLGRDGQESGDGRDGRLRDGGEPSKR